MSATPPSPNPPPGERKRVVILGGRGVGMIAASILERAGSGEVLGFLNDVVPVGTEIGKFRKYKVVGKSEDVGTFLRDADCYAFIAYIGMTKLKAVCEQLTNLAIPPDRLVNIIDPTAVIPEGYCRIGRGVLLAPTSQLGVDTTVADNCMLLSNSYVAHDSFLDSFARVANNAVVGADVRVGRGAFIGCNATVREKVRIGDYSLVGAGAVVVRDVPEGAVVAGNPARELDDDSAANQAVGAARHAD